ncbi:Rieske (2Fe-2S) protein [Glaciimonas immobilis]|nr:Rieske (2Fe-2S) protein [Glaciimonas immobilis]
MRAASTLAITCLGGSYIPIALADDNSTRPQPGHRLARVDAPGPVTPLRLTDIPRSGAPVYAFSYDPKDKIPQDGSRLNKIALVRVDTAALSEEAAKGAVDGVLAFSAVCTHQGCEVTEFLLKENALMCFCHFSKFDTLNSGAVISGPAPRNLPHLLLTAEGGEIVIAQGFSSVPGVKKSG